MMRGSRSIIVSRDISGVLVPQGHIIELKAGTPVRITQSLGGNHSVEVFGNLVMVASVDQDALGIEPNPDAHAHLTNDELAIDQKVIMQIKTCYDPEIPVNVYDLGLIYNINPVSQDNQYVVYIVMTLTSPSCGMGPFIVEDIKRKVHMIHGVMDVKIEIVFDPPWDKGRLSQAAKLQLNMM